MNERTKQLWEESQQWNGSDDGRGGLKILESIEKFAELIVRECVNWIDGSPATEEGTLILSKSFIIANLKQHFGVKE